MQYSVLGNDISDDPSKYVAIYSANMKKLSQPVAVEKVKEIADRNIKLFRSLSGKTYNDIQAWAVTRKMAQYIAALQALNTVFPSLNNAEIQALESLNSEIQKAYDALPTEIEKAPANYSVENAATMEALGLPSIRTGATIVKSASGKVFEPVKKSKVSPIAIAAAIIGGYFAIKNI